MPLPRFVDPSSWWPWGHFLWCLGVFKAGVEFWYFFRDSLGDARLRDHSHWEIIITAIPEEQQQQQPENMNMWSWLHTHRLQDGLSVCMIWFIIYTCSVYGLIFFMFLLWTRLLAIGLDLAENYKRWGCNIARLDRLQGCKLSRLEGLTGLIQDWKDCLLQAWSIFFTAWWP